MKIISKARILIRPNDIVFVPTTIGTFLNDEDFEFKLSNQLNSNTKLIYKGFKYGSNNELFIGLMNMSNKIEDYIIKKGQLLGFVKDYEESK